LNQIVRSLHDGTSCTEYFEGFSIKLGKSVFVKRVQKCSLSEKQVERAKTALNRSDDIFPQTSYIVKLFDLEEDENFYYLAYERCMGSLFSLMNPERPLEAKKIFEGAAKGLKSIHESDFIHRNIRPQNIMVFDNSVGKISDLLMSKEIDGASSLLSISFDSNLQNVSLA
jgi:serine/threonine protein kinase